MVETKKYLKFYFSPNFTKKASRRFQDDVYKELLDEGHTIFFDRVEYDKAKSLENAEELK